LLEFGVVGVSVDSLQQLAAALRCPARYLMVAAHRVVDGVEEDKGSCPWQMVQATPELDEHCP
jgi:hypothetical protein